MSPATGMKVPLLPDGKPAVKPASVSGAVFNVTTSIIGAGIMSIPATLKVLGVIPAFVLILIIAFLAELSVDFLMRFTHSGETTTYAGVMREAFGPVGSVAAQVCVMITNLGCLIMYLIIIGDVLSVNQPEGAAHSGILQQWFGFQWWTSREFALLIILVFVMLPLVLYRRVESLKFSSAISTLFAVLFVGICSVLAISAVVQGKTKSPRLFPQLGSQTSFFDLFTAVPVIVTAFTFHFNVHPIGFELSKPSDMTTAVRIALVICAAIYFAIGLFGYLLFGDSTDMNSYSLGSLIWPQITKDFYPSPLLLLAFSYLAAIAVPSIWYLFQFVGSTTAVCLAFIFPGAIVLRDAPGISTTRDKFTGAIMITLAIITSAIAISTNIYNSVSSRT
ncbi:putative Amino acid transporter [Quillaja saponaria]|uniref:Amino acid transporter n=1 Tax=Quillaja saponaria TaxID=32244 RepID=A0AAD7LVX4_QUISA|nr:putative Amino acid transporter [Quillaja saponaria]